MNKLKKLLRILFYTDAYTVALRKTPDNILSENSKQIKFSVLPENKSEWYADPFLYEKDGETFLFVEAFDYKTSKGYLAYCNLKDYPIVKFSTAIKEDFHMSFPNVFTYKNEIYMVPETCETKEFRFYKCDRFPDKWSLYWVAKKDVEYVDTCVKSDGDTIFAETHDKTIGKNMLFSIDLENKKIEEIKGENSFVDRRPGGGFINLDGEIFHVLQNCDEWYGDYLHIAKVDKFDGSGLKEKEIRTLKINDVGLDKSKKYKRIHTFNRCGEFEVIDLSRSKLDLSRFILKLFKSIKVKIFK